MHTITDEVVENQAFRGNVSHLVVEKGKLIEANLQAVKASRHLSHIMKLIEPNTKIKPSLPSKGFVAVLTGAKSDEKAINESGLFKLLKQFNLPFEYRIISSDRNPDELRRYCFDNKDKIKIVIAIAGGVPNLPIVVKGWLPDTPVVCVPLDNNKDYAFASLTTPKDRPVIVAGFSAQGLKKAVYIAKEILMLEK
jgi:phosphoribosylcarboxyaminoimidazole (NCAIR) mutase